MKQADQISADGQSQLGMTLIEVMVSLTMLGVVLVILGQGLTLGIRLNTDSKAQISSLNLCKQMTEKLKSQIQYSQAIFDGANTNTNFTRILYTDNYGEEITPRETPGGNPTVDKASASYRVTATVTDWKDSSNNTLSAVDANGVSHVLVKVLTVKVRALESASGSMSESKAAARDITLSVEMVRPAS